MSEEKGSLLAGVFGLTIIVCIIILTVNSCAIRKSIEGEANGQTDEVVEAIRLTMED